MSNNDDSKNKRTLIIFFVIILVGAILGGAFYFIYIRNGKEESEKEESSEEYDDSEGVKEEIIIEGTIVMISGNIVFIESEDEGALTCGVTSQTSIKKNNSDIKLEDITIGSEARLIFEKQYQMGDEQADQHLCLEINSK